MKQRTTEEFISLCKVVHKLKYNYSLTKYTKKDNRIKIICPIHGEFEQIANSHIRGSGCKQCAVKNINLKPIDDFINEAISIHDNKYDYSLVEYTGTNTKVKIICPIHGIFEQTPHNHLNGCDCKQCGSAQTGLKKRTNVKDFISKAISIHGSNYDYSLVEYISAIKKVKIICPVHGVFEQKPNAHIGQKQGCPSCYIQQMIDNGGTWSAIAWNNTGVKSKHFDSFKFYIIKCYNENESFIKVGKTFNTMKKRFKLIPYKCEVIRIVSSDDAIYIHNLEKRFKSFFKVKKYIPLINFGGKFECFTDK